MSGLWIKLLFDTKEVNQVQNPIKIDIRGWKSYAFNFTSNPHALKRCSASHVVTEEGQRPSTKNNLVDASTFFF